MRGARVLPVALLLIGLAAPAEAQIRADVFVSGFSAPIAFVQDPSDAAVQYVAEQGGRIRVIRNGVLQATDFLNLSAAVQYGGEQGLLGLAFPLDYASSGRFYVNFSTIEPHAHADGTFVGDTVVARFRRLTVNPLVADPASRFDLLWSTGQRYIVQDFANHNGGNMVFGPDGFLYLGMGDGGGGNDTKNRAQSPGSLLGKMLRIDVNVPDGDAEGFNIPPGNLFSTRGAAYAPEIWSIGLRNPWRWSFDNVARGGTGALVIGDVGQNRFEEIDYEPRGQGGRNYGWSTREGAHDNNLVFSPAFLPLTEPTFEYGREDGGSITGGSVYRGSRLGSTFVGRYFFADFISMRVWSLALTIGSGGEATASDRREHTAELGAVSAVGNVSAFGEDADGELYVVSYVSGRILKIVSTLPPLAPSVTTGAATGITKTSALFTATVNPNGSNTTAVFDYGPTTSYGQALDAIPNQGQGRLAVPVGASIPGLDCGRTYHYRARAANAVGVASGSDAVFTTAACIRADLLSPPPQSTLTAARIVFEWTGGTGVTQYWLYVGSTPGGADLYNLNRGANLDATVGGVPLDGRTIYVRLWSLTGSTWVFNDYTYRGATLVAQPADLTSPPGGTTLTASTVTFEWTGGGGVSQYRLEVGTTAGGNQIHSQSANTALRATLTNLPSNEGAIFVRLWSLVSGVWQFHDYQYKAVGIGPRRAQLLTPAPGSTLTASTVEMTWDGGTGVSGYWLHVGTAPGASDLFNADRGTNLNAIVSGLPADGRPIYARLWSHIGPSWLPNDYAFTSAADRPTRLAQMVSPAPGSALPTGGVIFRWKGASATFTNISAVTSLPTATYWLDVGTTPGGRQLFAQGRFDLNAAVLGLPTDGRTLYVRLWSFIDGTSWEFNDYVYTAAAIPLTRRAELTSPAPGTVLNGSRIELQWNGGAGVAQYWIEAGTTFGGHDLFNNGVADLRVTLAGLPTDGRTIYVRLWSLFGTTWVFNDYQYTGVTAQVRAPELVSPAPQSILTEQDVRFEWTGGVGVLQFWVDIGTSPGATNLGGGNAGLNLSFMKARLPADGRPIYVRLWYLVGGSGWLFRDYVFAGR